MLNILSSQSVPYLKLLWVMDYLLSCIDNWFVLYDCAEQENRVTDLHGEVMACGYEDVQVMWSILDKSKSTACNITSS